MRLVIGECVIVRSRAFTRLNLQLPSPVRVFWLVLAALFLPGLVPCLGSNCQAEEALSLRSGLARIDESDLKRHVNTLASDALEGRQAGSRGGKAAAAYIRSELARIRENGRLPVEVIQDFGREYQNLIVRLPGSDDRLKNENILVGAHYDHVGYGSPTNSAGPIGQIHNGADDNASGTAALLELVEAFSGLDTLPPRSLIFAFWDGEEIGLLGSKHFVAHPTVPLQDIRFVLNIDMVGRLRDGRVVTAGWRSAPGLRTFLASHNVSNDLALLFQPRVNADSDHYPFYANRIPAVHLDTEKHEDYHRPTDDANKINWDGVHRMSEFAYRILLDAASRPETFEFRREALRESPPSWLNGRDPVDPQVRLGVSWDEELTKKNIIQLTQVYQDSPAANAGMRVGDRITKVGPWEHGNFLDMKTTLQVVKNPVAMRVERVGSSTPVDLSVTFWGSPVRLGGGWVEDAALPNCVIMTHVIKESPADRAGLVSGDIIFEMGGKPIESSEEMRLRVTEEPGPFVFRVERMGRIRNVTVNLFDQPAKTLNEAGEKQTN